jgi:hypothetical protein
MKTKALVIGIIGILLLICQINAQTWSSTKRLTWTTTNTFWPVIATDSNNNTYVVWIDRAAYDYIYFTKSTDGGITWMANKKLTWNNRDFVDPFLCVDSLDNLHLTWWKNDYTINQRDIHYKKSADGGTTWTKTKRVTWNMGAASEAVIAVNSGTNLHIVWHDLTYGNNEILYKKSTNGGTTWFGFKRLTWNLGYSKSPYVVVDSSNTVHVVWYDDSSGNNEIYYKRSTDGGANWATTKRLTWNNGVSYTPCIAVAPNDSLHMVWRDSTPGNNEIFYKKSTDGGTTWFGLKRLTWSPKESSFPRISVGPDNNIQIVWSDSSSGNFEIMYKQSTDGGATWSGSKRLTWTSGESRRAFISVDSANNPHVVWHDNTSGNYEIYYKKGIH